MGVETMYKVPASANSPGVASGSWLGSKEEVTVCLYGPSLKNSLHLRRIVTRSLIHPQCGEHRKHIPTSRIASTRTMEAGACSVACTRRMRRGRRCAASSWQRVLAGVRMIHHDEQSSSTQQMPGCLDQLCRVTVSSCRAIAFSGMGSGGHCPQHVGRITHNVPTCQQGKATIPGVCHPGRYLYGAPGHYKPHSAGRARPESAGAPDQHSTGVGNDVPGRAPPRRSQCRGR